MNFIREHSGDVPGDWVARGPDWTARGKGSYKPIWKFVLNTIEQRRPEDARILEADDMFIVDLSPWFEAVERYFGKKPHEATRWLVRQYSDYAGEERAVFCEKFGGGTDDSIARRLGRKAKEFRELTNQESTKEFKIECDAAAGEASTDLYKFTFKILQLWPEPRAYLGRVAKVRKDK
jgi:hypothetical protein